MIIFLKKFWKLIAKKNKIIYNFFINLNSVCFNSIFKKIFNN